MLLIKIVICNNVQFEQYQKYVNLTWKETVSLRYLKI